MPFNPDRAIDQNPGPRCGAACAVYVLDWLKDQNTPSGQHDSAVAAAMKHTGTTDLTPNLGSTPSNIATYIKSEHPKAKIYAPTEVLTNWSTRPWMPVLRPALILSLNTSFCGGLKPKVTQLGVDTMIIKMMARKVYKLGSPMHYFEAHFIVRCGDNDVMDPDGGMILAWADYKRKWSSLGLDLYVQKG